MTDECILVLTSRTIEQMISEGGSQAWSLDATRARRYPFLVCAYNQIGIHGHVSQGLKHGNAFMVAAISAVDPAPENPGRYILRFDKYANVDVPAWNGQRNPVRYSSLDELNIDPDLLNFEAIPNSNRVQSKSAPVARVTSETQTDAGPLSIAAAKPRIAAFYQVPLEAIEIAIRG